MSRKLSLLLFALCIALGAAGTAYLRAEDAPATRPADGKPADTKAVNTKCPVSGEDIDPSMTIVYKGKPGPFGYHPEEVEAWLAKRFPNVTAPSGS